MCLGSFREVKRICEAHMSPRVCVIGAGFAGIATGVGLQKELGLTNFVIYDQNAELGGVWAVNKYPGARADVPAPNYCYSFAPNPNWSSVYASREEILDYLAQVAGEYKLTSRMRFNHRVKSLVWVEEASQWRVTVVNTTLQSETVETFDIVICCLGGLRTPNFPEVFSHFQGPLLHSAAWDDSVELEGRVVAVVGNGSSAAQIVPAIVDRVGSLISYQRHPTYFFPKPEFKPAWWLKTALAFMPNLLRNLGFLLIWVVEWAILLSWRNVTFARCVRTACLTFLKWEVGQDPGLLKKLSPDHGFGCRAPSWSSSFYSAMTRSNVELVRAGVCQVTSDSILTEDGVQRKVDVLILATGFRVSDYWAPLEVRGKGGVDLPALWKGQGPSAYMSISTAAAPNLFMVGGPNSVGPSSAVLLFEAQVSVVLRVLRELQKRESASVVVVREVVEKAYMNRLQADLSHTLWARGECTSPSWDIYDRGVVTFVNPYSWATRWSQCRRLDPSADFMFH